MIVRQTPPPRRPASAGGCLGSARARAIREQVKKTQSKSKDDTMAVAHRCSSPAPDPADCISGPGQFRSFAPDSKFSVKDPSNAGGNLFALGPRADRSDLGQFRTIDISRINAERHNWQRVDTFQTPAGHLSGYRLIEDLQAFESNGSLQRLLEVVRTEIRDGVREEMQTSVALIRDDVAKAASQIVSEVKVGFYSELTAREDVFKQQIGRLRNEIDFSPVFERIEERSGNFSQLLEQMQLTKTAVLKSLWECKNSVDISQLAENLISEVQKAKSGIDFPDVMEAISQVDGHAGFAFSELTKELQQIQTQIDRFDFHSQSTGQPQRSPLSFDQRRSTCILSDLNPILEQLKNTLGDVAERTSASSSELQDTDSNVISSFFLEVARVSLAHHCETQRTLARENS